MRNTEILIKKFEEASIKYGEEREKDGVPRIINKQVDLLNKVSKELYESYNLEKLICLLNHPNDYVKLNAATYVALVAPSDAIDTMVKLSEKEGEIGFSSKMFLDLYKKGEIKFEWKDL
ncbi:MAG: hypothetical protein ACOYWZ_13515 [Bacillota bacterium]